MFVAVVDVALIRVQAIGRINPSWTLVNVMEVPPMIATTLPPVPT